MITPDTSLRIDPTCPLCPDATNVPCGSCDKLGKNEPQGHEGDKGHVQRIGALLSGLFGNAGPLTTEPSSKNPEPPPPVDPPAESGTDSTNGKPPPVVCVCQFCESTWREDCENPQGIRCNDCGRLIWIDDGQSLLKVGWHDHDLGSMAPGDLPPCNDCGQLCDTQTLDGDWHCSRCIPEATHRRAHTAGLLRHARTVRQQTERQVADLPSE